MGLRSFVALPVEKGGAVIRLKYEDSDNTKNDTLTTSVAYGLNNKQTLLLGLPYQFESSNEDNPGDLTILYRLQIKEMKLFRQG